MVNHRRWLNITRCLATNAQRMTSKVSRPCFLPSTTITTLGSLAARLIKQSALLLDMRIASPRLRQLTTTRMRARPRSSNRHHSPRRLALPSRITAVNSLITPFVSHCRSSLMAACALYASIHSRRSALCSRTKNQTSANNVAITSPAKPNWLNASTLSIGIKTPNHRHKKSPHRHRGRLCLHCRKLD